MLKFVYNNKLWFLGFLLIMGGVSASAQNAIQLTEGSSAPVIIMLDMHPVLTQTSTSLEITTDSSAITYTFSYPLNVEFLDAQSGDAGISEIETEKALFKVDHNELMARNLTAGETVIIYDLSGHTVKSGQVSSDGTVTISISDLLTGVYVVNTKETKFKFYKK